MDLYERLLKYQNSGIYPFHMPGHKRQEMEMCNPYKIDITEIDGFDDLHHPAGILKEAQEETAEIYGAQKSWFLVNGSTAGILSATAGCVPAGGKLLMARNCHKSVNNAVFHRMLRPGYVYPQISPQMGIAGGILPEDVEKSLAEEPDISAVILVSPTYEGVISDIERIAEITKKKGIPLIVDEAHGAHFAFGKLFPVSALDKGADFVIQSLHKTLPSLTQTAVLHAGRNARPEWVRRVERSLSVYQSSSPSYILMSSIEQCLRYMNGEGKIRMEEYGRFLLDFREELGKLKNITLLRKDSSMYDLDISKLVLGTGREDFSGRELGKRLLEEYGLQMELCSEGFVIAMTSLMDQREGFRRLGNALRKLDEEMEYRNGAPAEIYSVSRPEYCMSPYEAEMSEAEWTPLEKSLGRISAETGYLYPPGIAFAVAGERIDEEILEKIDRFREKGLEIQGFGRIQERLIKVVKQNG